MERQHFEAVVIGSGQGGFPLAMALAGKRRESQAEKSKSRRCR
jgi:pyruvate/2-oxoglutarate dehydrogenase complex dihydrolipoamide dehydrogenase (E3) component